MPISLGQWFASSCCQSKIWNPWDWILINRKFIGFYWWEIIPFPGTIMTGADLQLWKQYSLTLPCSTLKVQQQWEREREIERERWREGGRMNLWIMPLPLVPMTTAAGFNFSASLHIVLPVSPSTIRALVLTYSIKTIYKWQ